MEWHVSAAKSVLEPATQARFMMYQGTPMAPADGLALMVAMT